MVGSRNGLLKGQHYTIGHLQVTFRVQRDRLSSARVDRLGPDSSLNHSRVARCAVQDPPLAGEYLLSGMVSGRDSRFRAQSRLGSDGVLPRRQERLSVKISAGLLESRLGLIMGE